MGVPKFFRWVAERYPCILANAPPGPIEPESSFVDNLYLDMNGIIHQCSHTDAAVADAISFNAIVALVCAEVERVFNMVQPRRLLYIAVDGVAPRAKLNQQRSRRFRTARDREEALQLIPPSQRPSEVFDSNCITPGTVFMADLSAALRVFIEAKMGGGWAGVKVHFSGAEVPGEGEHKIIQHIRASRAGPQHLPNQRHCILGADADMIMLALA
eukprot:CAMPEP_0173311838 /NCGR_PEP_ID=MMETSP1143-20121109/23769_1 /TAXON_ID=483371 /ORGANISM="non described non described, Strain CCMP2298" /LENGTH=213 /DNA_ID=CAMNT_0014253907 /DNA_START=100 /DNA_END=737 /DNA_ORIENTATION=+